MIYGQSVTIGGGGGDGLNIAYGTTPPADTSKLWVPLEKKPDNVEISGDSLQNAVDAIQTKPSVLPVGIYGMSSVAINGKVYIFGGVSAAGWTTTIQEYDPTTDTLTTKSATLKTAVAYAVAVAINGKAYIFGGTLTGNSSTSVIQEYDPVANTVVIKGAKLAANSAYHSAVAINGKAYIFGGYFVTSGYPTGYKTIQEYDPTNDTITTKGATLVNFTHNTPAVAIDGKAYIFGGKAYSYAQSVNTAFSTIQVYDPASDTLTTKNAAARIVYNRAAVAINGKAYIFGGDNGSYDTFTYIDEYDPVSDTFTAKSASLATGASALTAASIDDKAYIFGGFHYYKSGSRWELTYLNTVREYTAKAHLGANHLKVFASVYKSEAHQVVTNIVNGKKEQLKLYMTSAFLGDDDGYAKAQDAYVYNEADGMWQNLNGEAVS